MLSITFACFLFPFKTSPVCDYSLEPEVLKMGQGGMGGWVLKVKDRFVCVKEGGCDILPGTSFFQKLCEIIFFSAFVIFSSSCIFRPGLVIFSLFYVLTVVSLVSVH